MPHSDHRQSAAIARPGTRQPDEEHSYRIILKSSALIGGASMLTVAIGIARTKVMAVLLGPAGVGLMSLYSSIVELTASIAGMGVNSSGVRQIAEAVGSGETERIARTATVLRRASIVLGLIGAATIVLFSHQLSTLTFDSDLYAHGVALLSAAVLLVCISGGQAALIHGMRRIADLAKMQVLGALLGTLISIALVASYKTQGIVPSLVAVAATASLTSWWYSRKLVVQRPSMSISQVVRELRDLLLLGSAFMASGVMMTGAAYTIRLMLSREVGLTAAGLYQAAWMLGGTYVTFLLTAMNKDYYPRLTGVASDSTASNRLVNEQARISLLLAGPGILATLTFAPLVISLFYSASFEGAAAILRWICLGGTLQIIIVPVGYVILARNERRLFFWTEVMWTGMHVGLAWLLMKHYGAEAAGMAFFGAYLLHALVVYTIVRRINGFRWSGENRRAGLLLLTLVALTFSGFSLVPAPLALGIGMVSTLASTVYSLRVLLKLAPPGAVDRLRNFVLPKKGV